MHILTIVAFAVGLILGVFFRPLAIVAVAILFVAALFVFGSELGLPWILGSLLSVVAINVGYLAGAALARFRVGSSDTNSSGS